MKKKKNWKKQMNLTLILKCPILKKLVRICFNPELFLCLNPPSVLCFSNAECHQMVI